MITSMTIESFELSFAVWFVVPPSESIRSNFGIELEDSTYAARKLEANTSMRL